MNKKVLKVRVPNIAVSSLLSVKSTPIHLERSLVKQSCIGQNSGQNKEYQDIDNCKPVWM